MSLTAIWLRLDSSRSMSELRKEEATCTAGSSVKDLDTAHHSLDRRKLYGTTKHGVTIRFTSSKSLFCSCRICKACWTSAVCLIPEITHTLNEPLAKPCKLVIWCFTPSQPLRLYQDNIANTQRRAGGRGGEGEGRKLVTPNQA